MNEMTLEQAKETLQFQAEVMQQQTMEIGNLTTEKLSLIVQVNRGMAKIKELESALQGMVDAAKTEKENDVDETS